VSRTTWCNAELLLEYSRSHLLAVHELGQLLDEEMTKAEMNDLKEAEMVCRRFLAWNLEESETNGCAKAKLAEVLMREVS
jgi:DNA mismatch repair protein MSH5